MAWTTNTTNVMRNLSSGHKGGAARKWIEQRRSQEDLVKVDQGSLLAREVVFPRPASSMRTNSESEDAFIFFMTAAR
jgi:hypothetical protein